jgi:hypothetical protein
MGEAPRLTQGGFCKGSARSLVSLFIVARINPESAAVTNLAYRGRVWGTGAAAANTGGPLDATLQRALCVWNWAQSGRGRDFCFGSKPEVRQTLPTRSARLSGDGTSMATACTGIARSFSVNDTSTMLIVATVERDVHRGA